MAAKGDRLDLLEECAPKDSNLSEAVEDIGGAAMRIRLFKGFDCAEPQPGHAGEKDTASGKTTEAPEDPRELGRDDRVGAPEPEGYPHRLRATKVVPVLRVSNTEEVPRAILRGEHRRRRVRSP